MSYSQQNEEKYILEGLGFPDDVIATGADWAVETKDGSRQGRFLDIGAYHPKALSNTRALFELGWTGVMIEPSPHPMLDLLAEYGNESRITLVSGAVACEPGLVLLHVTDDAVSTSSDVVFELWNKKAKYIGKMLTPGIPLEYIALRFGGFDFINIDAEGISVDLFHGMMKLGWSPKAFCVEHDGREGELIKAATARSYSVTYGNETNLVLVLR